MSKVVHYTTADHPFQLRKSQSCHPSTMLSPSAPVHKLLSNFPLILKRSLLLWDYFFESVLLLSYVLSIVFKTLCIFKKFAYIKN